MTPGAFVLLREQTEVRVRIIAEGSGNVRAPPAQNGEGSYIWDLLGPDDRFTAERL